MAKLMQAGVSTACIYPDELEKTFSDLAVRNVKNVEIFVNTHRELFDPYLSIMKNIKDKHNINVPSIHPYTCAAEPLMLFTDYERRFNDALEYHKYYFEYMNKLGAKIFVLHGNKPQNPYPEEKYFERYASLQKLANSFGITIAQENVSRCCSGQLQFLINMKKQLGDTAKFVLDTKQAHRVGGDPLEFLKALGSSIIHVHYSDYSKNGDCLPFGFGDYDNDSFFKELMNIGYNGCIMIELYRSGFTDMNSLCENYEKLQSYLNKLCPIIV